MNIKINKRNELRLEETWDLNRLFKTEKDYENALHDILNRIDQFQKSYQGNITNAKTLNQALDDYRYITTHLRYINGYAMLYMSVDQTDETHMLRMSQLQLHFQEINQKFAFFDPLIESLDESIVEEAIHTSEANALYLKRSLKQRKYALNKQQKETLANYDHILNAHYDLYNTFKLSDMDFKSFQWEDKTYPMSFSSFENNYETNAITAMRRKAYEHFYQTLSQYQFGLAQNYIQHVLKEKADADIRGFKSVVDYLLYDQDVNKDLYERQIHIIMEKLAPVMRKYAQLIKETHHLETMTYADLKIALDPEFEPSIAPKEAKKLMLDGLATLGGDYHHMIETAFNERWIDFPQNIGKSTGGFCYSPYQKGSYILLNWNYQLDEAFVLAHELGHAGHFYYAGNHQNAFNTEPSLYFIEAPSTMNELILGEYLTSTAKDDRMKRFVLSSIVSRTYYHNMVTHLLEAAFQMEIYNLVDQKKPLSVHILNETKLDVLKRFWGEEVVIPDYAKLTWMRQPHYFMGLYSYTYSAGLTIATIVSKHIRNKTLSVQSWLDVLSAGGTKDPVELAKMVNIDISTEKPLLETIAYVQSLVDEIEQLNLKISLKNTTK